jgi:hypothetical protein
MKPPSHIFIIIKPAHPTHNEQKSLLDITVLKHTTLDSPQIYYTFAKSNKAFKSSDEK